MTLKMMVIIVIINHMRRAVTKQGFGCAARVVLYLLIWFLEALFL